MSLKKLLGFQVRSPGGPGPLTLKEVEELEHLTQQLMQDMEHPQRQNVAVSGEPATGRDAWPRHRAGWCLWLLPPPPRPAQASWSLTSARPSSYSFLSSLAFPESCGRCHQPLARAQPAVRALGQLFHITCFTCHRCAQQLQGQQFYSLEGAPYCEGCYTVSRVGGLGFGGPALAAGCRVPAPRRPPPASSGHPGEVQHLRAAHHRPHAEGHGQSLPPAVLHLCGLRLPPGGHLLHRGPGQPATLRP